MILQEDNSYWKPWNNTLAVIGQEGSEVSKPAQTVISAFGLHPN